MTERKKPGPKPKCKECGRKEGEGHYDDCPVGMGVTVLTVTVSGTAPMPTARQVDALAARVAELRADSAMTQAARAYALRVWEGQSINVPRAERLRRVALALEGQGLSMEGVVL